jgi:hypothetical protein
VILFFLSRRKDFSSDNGIKDNFDKNRSNIMSKLINDLQKQLK